METYYLQQWTPKIKEVAQKLMDEIHKVAPKLELLFMGAAALELPGKNDIDLDIVCDVDKIPEFTEKLIPILGNPAEQTNKIAVWSCYKDGIEIDAIISDSKISHVPEQKKVFETLKSSPNLLEEYRQLKINCDGLPYIEYEKKKKDFFHKRVLSEQVSGDRPLTASKCMNYFVYILRTSSNTLYIGQTNNLAKRLKEHRSKSPKSAKYLRYFTSFELVYKEIYKTRKEAMQREIELKKLTKEKKEALIQDNNKAPFKID